jgi:hypothetical protein
MRGRPEFTLGPWVARWIEGLCVHGPGDILGRPVELTVGGEAVFGVGV